MKPNREIKEFDAGDVMAVMITDPGTIRENNEDVGIFTYAMDEKGSRGKRYLMMVADGMGGHNGGEVASAMAAEIITREFFKFDDPIEPGLAKSFVLANRKIFERSMTDEAVSGMGTTCTAIGLDEHHIYYAHVGDSRGYLLTNDAIHRFTQDHTYVQELVKMGRISASDAPLHPNRNILTQAMGTQAVLHFDKGKLETPFRRNNILMICSDGLSEYLNENEIATILAAHELREAGNEMVEKAMQRGGRDNITVVLAKKMD